MSLVGHTVTHVERMKNEYIITVRRDNFGRPRERWEENTRMELKDLRV
jgi:hypothetical protein